MSAKSNPLTSVTAKELRYAFEHSQRLTAKYLEQLPIAQETTVVAEVIAVKLPKSTKTTKQPPTQTDIDYEKKYNENRFIQFSDWGLFSAKDKK